MSRDSVGKALIPTVEQGTNDKPTRWEKIGADFDRI